jgi:acyl-CoA synthetase (AMP-forming)/AMP-acid ligase II
VSSLFSALAEASTTRGLYLYRGYLHTPRFVSYAALAGNVARAMRHLTTQGVGPGTRVIFPFETSEEQIVAFLALLGVGALPLSIRPHLSSATRTSYLEFVAAVHARFGAAAILDAPSLLGLELPLPRLALPAPIADPPVVADPLPPRADHELAFVQFSSGSTAFPKGVPITHGQLRRNLDMIARQDGRGVDSPGTTWLPLFHDMGLVGGLLSSLRIGHDAHVASPADFFMAPLAWLAHISKLKISHTVIPNLAIDYCLRHLVTADAEDLADIELSALRFIYLGSEPINIDNLATFCAKLADHGLRRDAFKPCYGMAEAVLMVSCTPADASYRVVTRANGQRVISSGRLAPEFELELRDEDGRVCAPGELGELHLRGGTLADRYFEDDRPMLAADGYYATGDLGYLDDGDIFIAGRSGDRFKINAQSYFSSDFEQLVESLPCVRQARVAVVQIEGRVVVLAEPASRKILDARAEHEASIVARIADATGVKVAPEDVVFIRPNQLLHTSSGKLRRHAISEAYTAGKIQRIA